MSGINADLRSELSAAQAREAMMFKVLCLYGNHDEDCAKYSDKNLACDCLFGKAISNSTEHAEKFLAEVRANTLEKFKQDYHLEKIYPNEFLDEAIVKYRMANELREGK